MSERIKTFHCMNCLEEISETMADYTHGVLYHKHMRESPREVSELIQVLIRSSADQAVAMDITYHKGTPVFCLECIDHTTNNLEFNKLFR